MLIDMIHNQSRNRINNKLAGKDLLRQPPQKKPPKKVWLVQSYENRNQINAILDNTLVKICKKISAPQLQHLRKNIEQTFGNREVRESLLKTRYKSRNYLIGMMHSIKDLIIWKFKNLMVVNYSVIQSTYLTIIRAIPTLRILARGLDSLWICQIIIWPLIRATM